MVVIYNILLGINGTSPFQVGETTLCYLYILNCPEKTKGGYLNLCLMVSLKYVCSYIFMLKIDK